MGRGGEDTRVLATEAVTSPRRPIARIEHAVGIAVPLLPEVLARRRRVALPPPVRWAAMPLARGRSCRASPTGRQCHRAGSRNR